MGLLNIDDLTPEMVLASDLKSPQGRLLLPKGAVLHEEHFRICRIWGGYEADIANVSSQYADNDTQEEIDQNIIDASEALAERRFLLTNREHPAIQELGRLFVMRTSQRLAKEDFNVDLWKAEPTVDKHLPNYSDQPPPSKIRRADLQEIDSELVSLPDIFLKIIDALNNPRSSASYIADVISKDMSLSAKLLKLVNSSFYGFPKRISTLSRAVTVIGSKQLLTLAVGVSVLRIFKDISPELIDMESFWKHSIACGLLAKLIAGQINQSRSQSLNDEIFFIGGLVHDLGRLLMLQKHPQTAQRALVTSRQQETELVAAESELWGLNHATLGGELLRTWQIPTILEKSVRYHHAPLSAQSPLEAGIIHLADILAHSLDIGESGNGFIPALEPDIWAMTGLSLNSVLFLAQRVDQQLEDILRVFL